MRLTREEFVAKVLHDQRVRRQQKERAAKKEYYDYMAQKHYKWNAKSKWPKGFRQFRK